MIVMKNEFIKGELIESEPIGPGIVVRCIEDTLQIIPLVKKENLITDPVLISNDDLQEGSIDTDYFVNTLKSELTRRDSVDKRIGIISTKKMDEIIRRIAGDIAELHYESVHKTGKFVPGETYIRYSGRVYDEDEIKMLVDSSLDFWLTSGKNAKEFETRLSEFLGSKFCILTNSGSSANLLAISALTSKKLGDRRLKPGDEVITAACAFPTTVGPIIQNNLIPVFIDVDLDGHYNILTEEIEKAITKKTKAIFIAHTLGNPFNLDKVMSLAKKHDLFVIEDNCDALGSIYNDKYTGTFGHISTFSFYPPHHITMGEGGALVTDDRELKDIIKSFRDWGRDCYCDPGHDNTCNQRFSKQSGYLPFGYDHKYVYSHIGYNLKITDMQAAIGLAQMKKLPRFMEQRKKNWKMLYGGLKEHEDCFILPEPMKDSDPDWFGFVITVKKNAPFTRNDIIRHLEDNKIATRFLFSGNIVRQPCFSGLKYRIHKNLNNTDFIMNNTFWVGVYPGMTEEMIGYMIKTIGNFVKDKVGQ